MRRMAAAQPTHGSPANALHRGSHHVRQPRDSGMTAFLVLALGLVPALAATVRHDEPRARQKDANGWIDMLARPCLSSTAGLASRYRPMEGSIPDLNGRLTRPAATRSVRATAVTEWLRLDQTLTDYIFHVEWRFTPVPGKKGYNSGSTSATRPTAEGVASGPVRRCIGRLSIWRDAGGLRHEAVQLPERDA